MQNRFSNFLNRPFPLFLSYRKGRVYFIWLVIALLVVANIVHPFGFASIQELHRPLVLTSYVMLFFGLYALLHVIFSSFRRNSKASAWTVKKEFNILLLYIPTTACGTCLLADISIPEFELSLLSFLELQFYNSVLGVLSIPTLGYLVDTKLNPVTILRRQRTLMMESRLNLKEERAGDILQKLNRVMEIQQLYLSDRCSIKLLSSYSGIPERDISSAINGYSGFDFTDYVDKYRVEHVCRILQDDKSHQQNLEIISNECGFESIMLFYTVFEKFTGKTPADYLAEE